MSGETHAARHLPPWPHVPEQQSPLCAQSKPSARQQTLFWQAPEKQQSPIDVQAPPALRQQTPAGQMSPSAVQQSPSVPQVFKWLVQQWPPAQLPPQQSAGSPQVAVLPRQQVLVVVSQLPLQQSWL